MHSGINARRSSPAPELRCARKEATNDAPPELPVDEALTTRRGEPTSSVPGDGWRPRRVERRSRARRSAHGGRDPQSRRDLPFDVRHRAASVEPVRGASARAL